MPDFWRHSGFHLLSVDASGRLAAGDDFLRAYIGRPEVAPVAESCAAERTLFASLMREPRRAVSAAELAGLADPDARASYAIVLKFRDHLLAHESIEAAYSALFVDPDGGARDFAASGLPPLFADQLAHVITRHLLEGCDDALQARAGELFFREQRAHASDGHLLLADLETIEMRAAQAREGSRFGSLGQLIAQAQTPLAAVELDVLDTANASLYWERDERHDTAIDLSYGRAALDAYCRVLEKWLRHFFHLDAQVRPLRRVETARMGWFIGLDREATGLLNRLYNGGLLRQDEQQRIVALLELRMDDTAGLADAARGAPVILALAMNPQNEVRMKPQNLLINFPVRRAA